MLVVDPDERCTIDYVLKHHYLQSSGQTITLAQLLGRASVSLSIGTVSAPNGQVGIGNNNNFHH